MRPKPLSNLEIATLKRLIPIWRENQASAETIGPFLESLEKIKAEVLKQVFNESEKHGIFKYLSWKRAITLIIRMQEINRYHDLIIKSIEKGFSSAIEEDKAAAKLVENDIDVGKREKVRVE